MNRTARFFSSGVNFGDYLKKLNKGQKSKEEVESQESEERMDDEITEPDVEPMKFSEMVQNADGFELSDSESSAMESMEEDLFDNEYGVQFF